ncbi:4-(cytidine 5'-diphospho)-2-C-methyl-D-erythritol kinase [soil metagenome]
MDRPRALARAKINLRLAVLAREDTGFHQIETIFCALELADEIEIRTAARGITLEVLTASEHDAVAPELGPVGENLAVRAATAFFDAAGIEPRVAIRLTKRIPAGAGLGGGSSDAATVLKLLNEVHGAPLDIRDLLDIGAGLGSDVPFFIGGAAMALAWGRGGRLAPLPPLPSRTVLLAVPSHAMSTARAYADLAHIRAAELHGRQTVAAPVIIDPNVASWTAVAALAVNDFESVVFSRMPLLAAVRERIERNGAVIARMTGTGSVVFGVFEDPAAAAAARDEMLREQPDVRVVLTRTLEAV